MQFIDSIYEEPSNLSVQKSDRHNKGISLLLMKIDDQLHLRELCNFLKSEADFLGADFYAEKLPNILALKGRQIQIHFALANNQPNDPSGVETVGCTVQFLSALPKWNPNSNSFVFLPAIYLEDFVVSTKATKVYRQNFGRGLGTDFLKERMILAFSKKGQKQQNEIAVCAFAAEQPWHIGTAAGGLAMKFNGSMAKSKDCPVLVFDKIPSNEKNNSKTNIIELASHNKGNNTYYPIENVFAACWLGKEGTIAATFCDAISTYEGMPAARVMMSSKGTCSNDELDNAIAKIFLKAKKEILKRRWTENPEAPQYFRIHALNEPHLISSLTRLGAKPRVLGNHTMYPFVIYFNDVPQDMVGIKIPPARPLMGKCNINDFRIK